MTDHYLRNIISTLLFSNARLSLVSRLADTELIGIERKSAINQEIDLASDSLSITLEDLYHNLSFRSVLQRYRELLDERDATMSFLAEATSQHCIVNGKSFDRHFLQTQATVRSRTGIVLMS